LRGLQTRLTLDSAAALGEVVTIFIGADVKPYKVYKDLICYHSEYVRTVYNGRWKEAEAGVFIVRDMVTSRELGGCEDEECEKILDAYRHCEVEPEQEDHSPNSEIRE
jgi:hypothetical protein